MKRLKIFLLPIILTFTLISCEEEETAEHGLTAVAGTDREVAVGQTVELNSGASIDLTGEGFNSSWNFVSRPEGSSANLNNANSDVATFVPDVAGDYLVSLTISNSLGQSSDEVTLTAIAAGTQEIGGTYSEELHLVNINENPDIPDYIVTSNLSMSAKLRIDPGVRIEVMSDVLIRILQNGFIEANGTAAEPIIITGTSNMAGFWRGIWNQSSDFDNVLNHVHISGAGSNNITTAAPRAGLHVSGVRLNINHCVFSNITGYGISVTSTDVQIPLENCSFSENSQGAMRITAAQMRYIDNETDFNNHEIVITGTNINTGTDHTWPAPQNGNYRFSSTLNVFDNVTIEQGATLLFDNDVLLRFRDGVFKALGTETHPVVFKGSVEQAGSWRGTTIESSSLENHFEHVHYHHAGHTNLMSGFGKAAVGFSSNARGTFANVHFDDIDGYGIYIRYTNTSISLEELNFGQNLSQGAIHMLAEQISDLDNQSYFNDNYVVVNGGQIQEEENVVWPSLWSGKYLFTNTTTIWGKVSIEPGAILEFDNDVMMRVRTNGVLVANGTVSDNIIFTRRSGSMDHWKGLAIETSSLENSMDYVEISYAGNSNLISGIGQTNLGLGNNARLTLTNSTISNSLGYGIWLRPGAELTQSNISFTGNAEDDINEP
jgi:hypothetical protein